MLTTALTTVRDLLKTEMKPAKADGWLKEAEECRIGLHAEDTSYRATGLYVLPDRLRVDDEETNAFADHFRLRVIVSARSMKADASESDPATFALARLVGGVLDLLKKTRNVGSTGWIAFVDEELGVLDIPFEVAPLKDGSFAYRAAVPVTVRDEVTPA